MNEQLKEMGLEIEGEAWEEKEKDFIPKGATIEKELEDKYGSLKRDIGQDEEGMFFISESDSGNPSDEGYSISRKKVRIAKEDYDKLLTLGII